MTLLQLKYVLACVENGSIAKAAQMMYTSASNLSQSIKNLEIEVGFEIFHRTSSGVFLTEKGAAFYEYAMKIQLELDNINKLKEAEETHHFSCACMHLPYCYMAFEALCKHYEEDEKFMLSLNVDFQPQCVEAVYTHLAEIAVISMPETVAAIECQRIMDQGLTIRQLSEQSLNINLRKNHPVLKDYHPGEPFDLSLLHDYPYVSYSNFSNNVIHPMDFSHPSYCPAEAFNSRKYITVNNVDWKCRLIGNTNAYSIGTTGPESFSSQYHWQCIPIEGATSYLYYVYSDRFALSDTAKVFIQYLQDIINENPK